MAIENDSIVLKLLNKELKRYHVKLKFQYYDVSPFKQHNSDVVDIILKYSEMLESYYNKIFIVSSLCDKCFKSAVPYLIDLYDTFLKKIYNLPQDEIFLLHLCVTISKINSLEHKELYKKILCGHITQSAEPLIIMVSKFNDNEYEDIIFNLIRKENLIPDLWVGKLNEDSKYWCSFTALKCIVKKKNKKYLDFFKSIMDDQDFEWLNFSKSKYREKLMLEWKTKYKKLAQIGVNKIL